MANDLDERGRRRWAATEAMAIGHGGIVTVAMKMLRSKYFALAVAVATGLPVSFSTAANAQVGYSGPYGGYYPVPGGHNMAPLPSGGRSSSRSGRKYAGEYRFECEERLGIGQWKEMRDSYAFGHPKERYGDAMVKNIRSQCQSLPNP